MNLENTHAFDSSRRMLSITGGGWISCFRVLFCVYRSMHACRSPAFCFQSLSSLPIPSNHLLLLSLALSNWYLFPHNMILLLKPLTGQWSTLWYQIIFLLLLKTHHCKLKTHLSTGRNLKKKSCEKGKGKFKTIPQIYQEKKKLRLKHSEKGVLARRNGFIPECAYRWC